MPLLTDLKRNFSVPSLRPSVSKGYLAFLFIYGSGLLVNRLSVHFHWAQSDWLFHAIRVSVLFRGLDEEKVTLGEDKVYADRVASTAVPHFRD